MEIGDLFGSLRSLFDGATLESRLPPRYPGVAVELAPGRVTGVRVAADRKGGKLLVQQVATSPLPEGALEASLVRQNIVDPEPVKEAIGEVLGRLKPADYRISILVPDPAARVAILGFSNVPRTRRDLADLVRFRMSKSLPFKTENAVLDLINLGSGGGAPGAATAASVLAVFMNRAVLQQYEALFTEAGFWPGLVGLSTFELYNLFRGSIEAAGSADKDDLLLNVTSHYLSILIFSGGDVIFYRCKPHRLGGPSEELLVGLRREIYTSLAFYQEKLLGRGLGRAFLRATGMAHADVLGVVEKEVGCPVECVNLNEVLGVAESVDIDDERARQLLPAVGAAAGRRP